MIIGTNFKLSSAKFLDDRQLCRDYDTLIENPDGIIYPPGFEVFCENENKYYQYIASEEGYIWQERKSDMLDGLGAMIDDNTISETTTWSSAHIDSTRVNLEVLIINTEDYIGEIEERLIYVEGKFQWFEFFDGTYESLLDKPVIPTKLSELENDQGYLDEGRIENLNMEIANKVDMEEGKTLIPIEELDRLASVDNYNDEEIRQQIEEVNNKSHIHNNEDILNSITQEKIDQWDNDNGNDDYNYLQNKPITKVGDDSDITLDFNQIVNKGVYIITAMIGDMKIHNELTLVEWTDENNVKITIPNMFKVLDISKIENVWTIINELNYGLDKNNTEISNSLKIGEGNIVNENNQIVQGKFNEEDTEGKYINIVGNGENEGNRKNIHTLDWEGNGWYGGKLSQEGTPTEDKDLITKGYVDERFTNYATNERIDAIDKENARRDVIIEALANGRKRTIETDGNDVDLMFSTEKDKVWIDKIEGETLVNVCDQEEPIAITKSYTVERTNHVPLQGEYDGKCRPVVHGNTLVNHNIEYDKSIIIGERIDNIQGTEILNFEGTPNCEIKVNIDGHTAINLSTKKEDILCKSFDSASGNEINLVAEENSRTDVVLEGNTMVNLLNANISTISGDKHMFINTNNDSIPHASLKTYTIYNPYSELDLYVTIGNITDLTFKKHITFTEGVICNTFYVDEGEYIRYVQSDAELTEENVTKFKQTMLFEGDLTQTPELIPTEYVEGLKSTFEDKLIPYSIYNGDNLTSITETQYQLPLTVKPNTQYTITTTANTTKYQYAVYSTDGLTEYLSYSTTTTTQTFTCDTNNVLFKVRMNPSYEGDDYSFVLDEVKDKFLIVEGDWTSRLDLLTEEYFGKYRVDMSSIDNDTNEIITSKTVYLNYPLLNGDELLTKDGKLYHYHKMGKIVLDGSEDEEWAYGTAYAEDILPYIRFYIQIDNCLVNSYYICDKFPFGSNSMALYLGEGIGNYAEMRYVQININSTKLSTTDINGFKQWLSENPTTVVYELASPYYEEISTTEDMRFNIATTSTIEYQSNVPMANTQFLPYRNELPLLESSTQYRVTFDCDVEGLELMVSLGGTTQTITSGLHNELSFITPSLRTDGKLIIDGYGIAKIDNVLITKGDMEYKYFEGLESGFENEINEENKYKANIRIQNPNAPIFGKGGRL